MKIYNSIQNDLAQYGFIQNNDQERYYPFSKRHLMNCIIAIISMISVLLFGIEVAESPKEYMDSFFGEIMLISIFISYTTMIFQTPRLFGNFNNCEKFKRECK